MKPLHDLTDDELAHQARRALTLPDAPAAWIQRAVALQPAAAQSGALAAVLAAGWRLVVATLRFDSAAAAPAAALALRSAAGSTRHLLFSAEGRDLDLRISRAADGYTLSGQVLGPDESGEVALVYGGPDEAAAQPGHRTAVDELGEFSLVGLRGGTCTVTFLLGRDRITLPPITLGDNPP